MKTTSSALCACLLLACCVGRGEAFLAQQLGGARRVTASRLSSSSSSQPPPSPPPPPTVDVMPPSGSNQSSLKDDLLAEIDLASSSDKRTAINELMLRLESMNPTPSPATSPDLNGEWEFLHSGGRSAGMLSIQLLSKLARRLSAVINLKAVTLSISKIQPRVEASVDVAILGRSAGIKVRTHLEAESEVRLSETYEEAVLLGRSIPIPSFLQRQRTLFITYLDEDLLIARDNTGAPDLLVRKEKAYEVNGAQSNMKSASN